MQPLTASLEPPGDPGQATEAVVLTPTFYTPGGCSRWD